MTMKTKVHYHIQQNPNNMVIWKC